MNTEANIQEKLIDLLKPCMDVRSGMLPSDAASYLIEHGVTVREKAQIVIHNRSMGAQYIYVGDDGYGNLRIRHDCSGTPIMIVPPIINNPVEYCSVCRKRLDDTFQNFCPNCGAEIRKENTDE